MDRCYETYDGKGWIGTKAGVGWRAFRHPWGRDATAAPTNGEAQAGFPALFATDGGKISIPHVGAAVIGESGPTVMPTWPQTKPDRAYQVVRLAIAAILLTAAALKGYDLATGPVVGTGLLSSRWVLVGVVEVELFLAFWVVGNVWRKLTWLALLACFSAFSCVSLYKALSGYPTCGLFRPCAR